MTRQSKYLYDIFISHDKDDREWVNEWLLPRLEQADLRVFIDYRDFTVGKSVIENIEWAVENSHRTIVVLTPSWVANEWNAFEALLLRTLDPAARQRKLLPLLLKPCDLPKSIDSLEKADLTVERHWEKQLWRVTRDIQDIIPVSPPWREGNVRDFTQWKRWLRRYRRELRRGVAAIGALWLLVSMSLQLGPFEPRQVWTAYDLRAPDANKIVRSGNVLLVGSMNTKSGCDHLDKGLWRSTDNGMTWHLVHAPLCFVRDEAEGEVLAAINGFALTEVLPERIYAATSDVGLLRSDNTGQTWQRVGETNLENPQLTHVAVDPDNADLVFVVTEPGGLYRSSDGGQHWQRLDNREPDVSVCDQGMVLTRTIKGGALLAIPGKVVIGTNDPNELSPDSDVPSGLYVSSDKGNCWERVDDGKGRYQYAMLTHLPTAPGQSLLMVTIDQWKESGIDGWQFWHLDVALSLPQRELLWTQDHIIEAIIADGGADPGWYAANSFGEVVRGSLVPDQIEDLPRLTHCIVDCTVDLTVDIGKGPPVLLANSLLSDDGRVFRLTHGPWWRRIWP